MRVCRDVMCLEWFGCETCKAFVGAKYHSLWGRQGLGNHLAGGARRAPNKHNGGSPANSGSFGWVVCWAPLHVRGLPPPSPLVCPVCRCRV